MHSAELNGEPSFDSTLHRSSHQLKQEVNANGIQALLRSGGHSGPHDLNGEAEFLVSWLLDEIVGPAGLFRRLLEAVPDALTVCDGTGTELYSNPSVSALIQSDPESSRVLEEIEVLARSHVLYAKNQLPDRGGLRVDPLTRRVVTRTRLYGLQSTYLGELWLHPKSIVLINLRPLSSEPRSDDELRQRYGLTRKEIPVARQVAEGRSNRQIAEALFLSSHTVRHHVEHILSKLGVHSRKDVKTLLMREPFELLSGGSSGRYGSGGNGRR